MNRKSLESNEKGRLASETWCDLPCLMSCWDQNRLCIRKSNGDSVFKRKVVHKVVEVSLLSCSSSSQPAG